MEHSSWMEYSSSHQTRIKYIALNLTLTIKDVFCFASPSPVPSLPFSSSGLLLDLEFQSKILSLKDVHECMLSRFSHVQLFVTQGLYSLPDSCPWDFPGKNTGVGGIPQARILEWVGFPRQEYWSGWDFPGKNTGVGCHALLQGIFPTQRLNPGLLRCRRILYHWATGKVCILIKATSVLRKPQCKG